MTDIKGGAKARTKARNIKENVKGRSRRTAGALLESGLVFLILIGALVLIFAGNDKLKLDTDQTATMKSPTTSAGSDRQDSQDNGSGSMRVVRVVATIFPLADIARQIGGNRVNVTTLLPPGASPHTFELTPGQAREIANADVIIRVGSGLDDWALRSREGGRGLPPVIIVLTGNSSDHDHAHGDPHIWLDPVRVKDEIAPRIAEALAAKAPDARELFESNLRKYQGELEILHDHIARVIRKCRTKKYISFHSAWRHFGARYGLTEVASIEEFPGREPSARWIANIVNLARKNEVKVIFAEPQFSPKVARAIAGEIGGRVLLLDPLGGEGIQGRDSYLGLMNYNLSIFEEALQ
ncbi:MAG TPA: zinc ABC transporter substrate-binding protein [Firmicutes bacterium]|nr:zinc ABC transporter substrate-binding protein [Bacillota bacterium]